MYSNKEKHINVLNPFRLCITFQIDIVYIINNLTKSFQLFTFQVLKCDRLNWRKNVKTSMGPDSVQLRSLIYWLWENDTFWKLQYKYQNNIHLPMKIHLQNCLLLPSGWFSFLTTAPPSHYKVLKIINRCLIWNLQSLLFVLIDIPPAELIGYFFKGHTGNQLWTALMSETRFNLVRDSPRIR